MNCQTTKLINKNKRNNFFNSAIQCLSFIDFNSHLSFESAMYPSRSPWLGWSLTLRWEHWNETQSLPKTLSVSLNSCVALGEFYTFSKSLFNSLKNEDIHEIISIKTTARTQFAQHSFSKCWSNEKVITQLGKANKLINWPKKPHTGGRGDGL